MILHVVASGLNITSTCKPPPEGVVWGTGDAEDEDDVNPRIKKYNAAIMCNSVVEDCGATAREILANINGDIFMFVLIMEMLGKIEK